MNIPKVPVVGQFSLCGVRTGQDSARSFSRAVTPHKTSLHIKSEMLSSTFQIVV